MVYLFFKKDCKIVSFKQTKLFSLEKKAKTNIDAYLLYNTRYGINASGLLF